MCNYNITILYLKNDKNTHYNHSFGLNTKEKETI